MKTVLSMNCMMCSIYGADTMLSSVAVKSERRDRRNKSDHDHRKSYFEKPAEACTSQI